MTLSTNFTTATPQILNQTEIMANIASDGTITLQQNDLNNMPDLSNLQFTNNETIFQLPNIVKTNEIIEEPPPQKAYFCTFKKCNLQNLAFANQTSLQAHMDTYHQPPFSPLKKVILARKFIDFMFYLI